jgi:hypothetical protein
MSILVFTDRKVASGDEVWKEYYRNVRVPHLDHTVTGFDGCIDHIIPFTAGLIGPLRNSAVPRLLLDHLSFVKDAIDM